MDRHDYFTVIDMVNACNAVNEKYKVIGELLTNPELKGKTLEEVLDYLQDRKIDITNHIKELLKVE